jgi:hypothetical protein
MFLSVYREAGGGALVFWFLLTRFPGRKEEIKESVLNSQTGKCFFGKHKHIFLVKCISESHIHTFRSISDRPVQK